MPVAMIVMANTNTAAASAETCCMVAFVELVKEKNLLVSFASPSLRNSCLRNVCLKSKDSLV
jgi:hypothetical protein